VSACTKRGHASRHNRCESHPVMTSMQNILVATDFGDASTRALEVAAEIANRFGAKLTIVHAIEELSYTGSCAVAPEIRRSAAFRLAEAVKHARRQVPALEAVVREGFAWNEIVGVAKEICADLVVVGSKGRGDDSRLLIGSVAEKVVRLCASPVLTVHAWRFENRTQAARELAELVLRSEERSPDIVAISRGAAVVAAEVAEGFGVLPHVLLTRALERDGCVLGAVCEDGTVHFNDAEGEKSAGHRDEADAGCAREELIEEARRLRIRRWPEDGGCKTVVLVSDGIVEAAPIIVAAKALRRMGSRRIVAAAPVAALAAREALNKVVDAVVVVQMVEDGVPLGHVYRDLSALNDRTLIERLATAAQWAQAVEKQV